MDARPIARITRSRVHLAVDPIYKTAEEAFLRDDLQSCRSLLDLCQPESRTERARVALLHARVARLEDHRQEWHDAAARAMQDGVPPSIRLTALALAAVAARRLGMQPEADRRFAKLDAELKTADVEAAAYSRYLIALEAWVDRDYDRAERLARAALSFKSDDCDLIALLGWIEEKRESYAKASTYFRKAFAILQRSERVPVRHQGVLLRAILSDAVERADLAACKRFAQVYEKAQWSANMRDAHFNAASSVRAAALLEGDIERAWLVARDSIAIADSGPYRVMAEVELAASTLLLGDRATALLQLRMARDLIREVHWSTANAEKRLALLDFAGEAAAYLPSEARQALMLYISIREKKALDHSLTGDRRIRASECVAAGRVAEALGERSEAVAQLQAALAIWNELGMLTRAASTAVALLRLTRDASYRGPIDALAFRAPNSSIVREASYLAGPAGKLGPIQRRVLAAILQGDGAKAIARDFDRSEFTIINHTRKIFAAFAVNSRAELRRECAKANITVDLLTRSCARLEDASQRESTL